MVANIMLALHCKKTEAIDLKSPIWEYISNTYSVDQVNVGHCADCAKHIPSAASSNLSSGAVSMQLRSHAGRAGADLLCVMVQGSRTHLDHDAFITWD